MNNKDSSFYTVVQGMEDDSFAIAYLGSDPPKILIKDLDRKALYFIMEGCSKWLDSLDESNQGTTAIPEREQEPKK